MIYFTSKIAYIAVPVGTCLFTLYFLVYDRLEINQESAATTRSKLRFATCPAYKT